MSNRQRNHSEPKPDMAAMLDRAMAQLMAGDALAAQRTTHTAEQLFLLEARLKRRAQTETQAHAEQARAFDARRADLDARQAALNEREYALACEAELLDELKQSLEALYAEMYDAKSDTTLP